MKVVKCKFCDNRFTDFDKYVAHIEQAHNDMIPEGMSPQEFTYSVKTGKTHGNCIICKAPTNFNPKTNKYYRYCSNPKCKEKYIETFRNRMISVYGKTTLLNDPEQQKLMLSHRKISGTYEWSDHNPKHNKVYTGSYEKAFLEFLDIIMDFDPDDIMTPSPHTYIYQYENQNHFYIPDMFIPSLNLEIEIKDGGDNANMHPKIQAVDKVKEQLKDKVMMTNKAFNYLKITNKNHRLFFDYLEKAKQRVMDDSDKLIFMI